MALLWLREVLHLDPKTTFVNIKWFGVSSRKSVGGAETSQSSKIWLAYVAAYS